MDKETREAWDQRQEGIWEQGNQGTNESLKRMFGVHRALADLYCQGPGAALGVKRQIEAAARGATSME